MTPTSIDFADFFDYLLKARGRLLEWIREQPSEVYTRTFQIGLGSIRATLVHIAEREWGYAQRLAGTHYGRGDLPFTEARYPEFEGFAAAWMRQAPATRQVLVRVNEPARSIEYVSRLFVPPMRTRTTAGGIAGQLLFHEVHHRAQVMAMMRHAGVAAENLDYSILVWERTPIG